MISNSKPNNYEGDFEINENYEDQNYNDNDSVDSLNLDYLPNEKLFVLSKLALPKKLVSW